MAKIILTFEDIQENGEPKIALGGEFIQSEGESPATPAGVMGLAVKRLFESQWLGKNCQNIVPELFTSAEEYKNEVV
jgi:hypothetical protein